MSVCVVMWFINKNVIIIIFVLVTLLFKIKMSLSRVSHQRKWHYLAMHSNVMCLSVLHNYQKFIYNSHYTIAT